MFDGKRELLTTCFALIVFMGCLVSSKPAINAMAQERLPDLTVDADNLKSSADIRTRTFNARHCAVVEGCASTGRRKLLRFNVTTPNIGDADLFLGDPEEHKELYEYSPCHKHYHFRGYAVYELLRQNADETIVVLMGRKQAFCLSDSFAYTDDAGPSHGYHCEFQGLTAGWADIYGKDLDCQWLDITGLPSGMYLLRVTVNPDRVLMERDYMNNTATVPVMIQ